MREIAAVLATSDVDDRNAVIAAHLRRLEERLTTTTAGVGHALVLQPCDPTPDDGTVRPVALPARDLAVTVHRGGHHDTDLTYAALGRHLADNALTLDGPVRETYLVGPRDTAEAKAWRTEIGWPVFRTAA